jgi:CrcB protein
MLQLWGPAFPWGTLCVNLSGGVMIGVLSVLLSQGRLTLPLQALLMTGFLGGLTTFSSFSLETVTLLQQQRWLAAGLNMVLNLSGALAGVGLGQWFTQRLSS